MTLALLVGGWLVRRPFRGRRRPAGERLPFDPLRLALLLRIGLSSGLSLSASLVMALPHVDRTTAEMIEAIRRDGLVVGLSAAMGHRSGDRVQLFRVLADAHLSGAPVLFAVNTFINDEIERRRSAALHQARVLPVRLTLPVALGLLPGFVLLAIAPQIVLALRDLVGQVAGL